MQFEKIAYADGFQAGTVFRPTEDFMPLEFDLADINVKVLASLAMEVSIVGCSDFKGLALTSVEREAEQELLDNRGLILTGKMSGWLLLGCRAVCWDKKPDFRATFYVFNVKLNLQFKLVLGEGKDGAELPPMLLGRLKFIVCNLMLPADFNKLCFKNSEK